VHEAGYVQALLLQRHGFSQIEVKVAALRVERCKRATGFVCSAVRAVRGIVGDRDE